jgi:hypothetical protein
MKNTLKSNVAVLPPLNAGLVAYREYRLLEYQNNHDQYKGFRGYLNSTRIGENLCNALWRDVIEVGGWFDDHLQDDQAEALNRYNEGKEYHTERLFGPFLGTSQVFVATVGHRGCLGARKTVVLNNVRLHGGKIILADHVWMKWTEKWNALEPLYGDAKVLVVGRVEEYQRSDLTRDLTIKATKIVKL